MKKSILEKSFVVILFVLVMIVFSFAERDTQKVFEMHNAKSTVKTIDKTSDYTAETPEKFTGQNKPTRN
jgi:uncharacterized protein YqhQ